MAFQPSDLPNNFKPSFLFWLGKPLCWPDTKFPFVYIRFFLTEQITAVLVSTSKSSLAGWEPAPSLMSAVRIALLLLMQLANKNRDLGESWTVLPNGVSFKPRFAAFLLNFSKVFLELHSIGMIRVLLHVPQQICNTQGVFPFRCVCIYMEIGPKTKSHFQTRCTLT